LRLLLPGDTLSQGAENGRHFAFMEYGVQDGSGFPFASVFVIDLDRDAWAGSPVRILLRKEASGPREAMRIALRNAAAILKRAGIAPLLTGRELFHAPPTEGTEAAITATFAGWPWQSGDARWKYVIDRVIRFTVPGDGSRDLEERDVVIIRYGHPAFEGLDQRYLAIPVRLPEPSAR